MKRVKLGDVFEIETPKGKAYLHYVYKDKMMGYMVRVLPGLYQKLPSLRNLTKEAELYLVFFPLGTAYKRGIVRYVDSILLEGFEKPRYMKDEHFVRGKFLGWHIVDTETLQNQLVKNLNKEQKKLSPWGIWNDTMLIERLTQGWTPELNC